MFNGFERLVYVWSVLSKCLFPCLPGGWDTAPPSHPPSSLLFTFLSLGSSAKAKGWLNWRRPTRCTGSQYSMPSRPLLPLCPPPRAAGTRRRELVSHSLSVGGCYLWRMAAGETFIPPDTPCVPHRLSSVSGHINNYTAAVLLIIAAAAQRSVFCSCREAAERNELRFFLELPGSQIRPRCRSHRLKVWLQCEASLDSSHK